MRARELWEKIGEFVRPKSQRSAGANEIIVTSRRGDIYWRIIRTLPDGTLEHRQKYQDPFDPEAMKIPLTNITSLFEATGIATPFPILVQQTDSTYPYDEDPLNNWLYAAFNGFKELEVQLRAEGKKCEKFCTVGVGPGIDAIGAHYVFNPQMIAMADIHEEILEIAQRNLRNNAIPKSFRGVDFQGSLFDEARGGPYDVIYANLPNIPAKDIPLAHSIASATYVKVDTLRDVPEIYDHYLLAHQWKALEAAKTKLVPGGSIIMALGGRVPYKIIEGLFADQDYDLEGLYSIIKVQTQPEDVISGYAEAEKQNGVTFTFYEHEKLMGNALCSIYREGYAEERDQRKFVEYAVSAQEALQLHRQGKKISHLVLILRGKKRT